MQLIIVSMAMFSTLSLKAQVEFGIKGGLNFTFFKVDEGEFGTDPEVELGYYAGGFLDFQIDEKLHFQPELLYISLGDFDFLNVPIYFKYNIKNRFNILVGPSLNYFFDFLNAKLKVRADLAFTYNAASAIDIHIKYTIGFEKISPNVVFLGLGYKL